LRTSRAAGIALVVALVGFTACDKESPVAPGLPPTSIPTAGPLAVTIAWSVAPPVKSVRIGDNTQSYIFTATVTGGVAPYTFSWQFGDGTPLGTGNPVTHQFHQPWTYQVWATVTDAAGNVARSDAKGPLEVEVTASKLAVTCFVGPQSGVPPLDVELDAVTDGNVGGVSWRWDFGDGTNSTSRRTRHSYGPGTFMARATASDGLHRTASCSKSVSTSCPAGEPYESYNIDVTFPGGSPRIVFPVSFPPGFLATWLDLLRSASFTVNSVTFVSCSS
jgi:hypothetical protein